MITKLELDDEQLTVLREILEAQRVQLITENNRTDTADYRKLVRHRLEIVEALRARLPRRPVAV